MVIIIDSHIFICKDGNLYQMGARDNNNRLVEYSKYHQVLVVY